MDNLPTNMTKDEYEAFLASYIREQMPLLTEGRKSLSFWANFNREKKNEFDELLIAQGVVVSNN